MNKNWDIPKTYSIKFVSELISIMLVNYHVSDLF